MMKPLSLGSLLLLSSALIAPAAAAQQQGAPSPTPPAQTTTPATPQDSSTTAEDIETATPGDASVDEAVDISAPGGEEDVIVVQGRYIPEPIRASSEVISVLSTEDIARTGEGDIAGALQRVTGLSLVGGRFVYVRGLGERYSLALLNGLPLPSPEPLRRVVPLDIFPTSVIASSVVQKSYSVNYPGEFGGGVINLTTASIPDDPYLKIGGSIGMNTETTSELGYTYFGSDTDLFGFDDGSRDVPAPLQAALDSGSPIAPGGAFSQEQLQGITASLNNASTSIIQRNNDIPMNFSVDLSAGTAVEIGDGDRLGIIAGAGWDNSWQTQGGLQQFVNGLSQNADGEDALIAANGENFRFLSTANRIVVNGLLGFGYEFGENQIRWTNLYIRDTIKEARIQSGTDQITVGDDLLNRSFTNWFERQLIDTQFVGEFEFGDISVDVRGTYANTQRESPYERSFSYAFDEEAGDYVNDLRTNGQNARIAFSDLGEDVWGGGIDLSYALPTEREIRLTAGYAYTDTSRSSTRRSFRYLPETALPFTITQARPDYLLSDFNIYNYGITLQESTSAGEAIRYDAGLEVHGGYIQAEAELADFLRGTLGVRYESADQFVAPVDVFGGSGGGAGLQSEPISEDYFLPAATLTWNFAENMQLRLAGSKTIARPQFRELAFQQYFDPEVDLTFIGNPFLRDSELYNGEARFEYYPGENERISIAGFYKKIENPIETIATSIAQSPFISFANAPEADLYGAEVEVQKYFPLADMFGDAPFLASRDLVIIANYTYTQSELGVSEGDQTFLTEGRGAPSAASLSFFDGDPLTGQSDHLANLQIGFEDSESLSQQTLLLSYASERVSIRDTSTTRAQELVSIPFVQRPGVMLDLVIRQGFEVAGRELEFKLEARNLLDTDFEEVQEYNGSRIDRNSYDLGQTVSISLGATF